MKVPKKWEAPTATQEQLIAMQVSLNKLKDELAAKKLERQQKGKQSSGKEEPKQKKTKRKFEEKDKPDWLLKPPPIEEIHKTRTWNKKERHYCCKETGGKCGGVWRVYLPGDCRTKQDNKKPGKDYS